MSRLQSQPRLALVRECIPNARRIASDIRQTLLSTKSGLWQPRRTGTRGSRSDFAVATKSKGIRAASEQRVEAILPLSDPMALGNAERIGALSLKYKVPIVSPFREITYAGGLLSYGPDLSILFRRSVTLVDQILKGAKPGDLPIGKPSEFELSKPAGGKVLNVTIRSILTRAAYVLENARWEVRWPQGLPSIGGPSLRFAFGCTSDHLFSWCPDE
jgi:putative ABC transport system substrate-binding protein